MPINPAQLISTKRDGGALSESQIRELISGYADGSLPDYQVSAFAMAVYFQGMNREETRALTQAMLNSGSKFTWADNGRPKVDKHSTGGIGDKISIPLAPILASVGFYVPMISGRGLGATGGTLDKLESIQGFRTDLSIEETQAVVEKCGCVITGASPEIAPADRKLYALRDVTGTVPSIPLITGSILSKKLAETLDGLVLDVKYGSGAFMKSIEQARELADSLVQVANDCGVPTSALLTNMNQPIGRFVGNAVEIQESIAILKNEGPEDTRELTTALACELISRCTQVTTDQALAQIDSAIQSGDALRKLEQMIELQGGRIDRLQAAESKHVLESNSTGSVTGFDSEQIGWAIIEMGGGRKQLGDPINHGVGIEVLVKSGDTVEKGQPLYNVFCDQGILPSVRSLLEHSITIGSEPPTEFNLIADRVG